MPLKQKAYGVCLYKKTTKSTKILLCKGINSKERWGCLKGGQEGDETKEETAIREFYEESSILVKEDHFEQYFFQANKTKDIGIFLVNGKNIQNLDNFFSKDMLKNEYLSEENSEVCFFEITNLPKIKQKQYKIIDNITKYLTKD